MKQTGKHLGTGGMLTRREACVVLGALSLGALGLTGCGGANSDSTSRAGFAGDTEVKSYPVHLKLYADSNLQWRMHGVHKGKNGQPLTQIDDKIERYQQQKDRSQVSFEVMYVDTAELLAMALEGFPGGDGLLALHPTMLKGCESGTVDGGVGLLSVRDQSYHFAQTICLVRAVGSDVDLPPAATLAGEDSPDGGISRLQQLPSFDGMIALADPSATLEGRLANSGLADRTEFYLDGSRSPLGGMTDGYFREDIAGKFITYPNQDAAMAAVAADKCQLGFALKDSLEKRYPEVEICRGAPGRELCDGAALACSAEPGVMRDFFEFITRCSD